MGRCYIRGTRSKSHTWGSGFSGVWLEWHGCWITTIETIHMKPHPSSFVMWFSLDACCLVYLTLTRHASLYLTLTRHVSLDLTLTRHASLELTLTRHASLDLTLTRHDISTKQVQDRRLTLREGLKLKLIEPRGYLETLICLSCGSQTRLEKIASAIF